MINELIAASGKLPAVAPDEISAPGITATPAARRRLGWRMRLPGYGSTSGAAKRTRVRSGRADAGCGLPLDTGRCRPPTADYDARLCRHRLRAPPGGQAVQDRPRGRRRFGCGSDGRRVKPVALLKEWTAATGIAEEPIFGPLWKNAAIRQQALTGHAVAKIVKARFAVAGLDPEKFRGHSLRAGFVTAAAMAGADVWKIQQVSRHKSMQVLSGYVRDAKLFDDHAGDGCLRVQWTLGRRFSRGLWALRRCGHVFKRKGLRIEAIRSRVDSRR